MTEFCNSFKPIFSSHLKQQLSVARDNKNYVCFWFMFMKTLWKNISLLTTLQEYADSMSAITTDKNRSGHIVNQMFLSLDKNTNY